MYQGTIESGLFNGRKDADLSDRAIQHLLDALVAIDLDFLQSRPQLPLLQLGQMRKVRYFRTRPVETPYGTINEPDHWRDIPQVLFQGYGDCKDLASWLTAEYLLQGIAAGTKILTGWAPDERRLYHVVVEYVDPQDGRVKTVDPSKLLGMKTEF